MDRRRPLVAANWKMHGTLATIRPLVREILAGLADPAAEIAICAPFPYLEELQRLIGTGPVAAGAQNLSEYDAGAHTGEVSAGMLKDYNCQFVIVGHSERRTLYGESDSAVARKFAAALRAQLTPILCVGERLEERQAGRMEEVVSRQLDCALRETGAEAFERAVIAYEPVWAIGTGRNATPEQAQEAHAFIRARLARANARVARGARIVYGGSVKAANAASLFQCEDVDGGLIGGASLDAGEFLKICKAVE